MLDFEGLQNPWRCHWSDEFQKKGRFFFGKSCSRDFGATACHPSTLIDFINTAIAEISSVEPLCMISEGYRTHGGVTGPMKFKKKAFFSENRAPGLLGPLAAMQALYLTLQTLLWPVKVP